MVLWSRRKSGQDTSPDSCMENTNQAREIKDSFSEDPRKTFIKKMSLSTMADIPAIQGEIQQGNMTIVDVAGFITSGEFSVLELKRAIEQIRGTCKQLGGALARLGDRYLIATPNSSLQFYT